jgi:penicillin-binding protein 2
MHRLNPSMAAVDRSPSIRRRLALLAVVFVGLELTVFARLISIEFRDGGDYRTAAEEPIVRERSLPAMRGRILAHDGAVLAYDQPVISLAVNYRWLEEPANAAWLRRQARSRLPIADRRKPNRIAEAEQQILEERNVLASQLSALCGLSEGQWEIRARRIQRRIESIAASVNSRHQLRAEQQREFAEQAAADESTSGIASLIGRSVVEALFAFDRQPPLASITIAEEVTEHVMFEGLSLEAIAEIESNPTQFSAVKLVRSYRRAYPERELAAHSLGYLSTISPEELVRSATADPHNEKQPLEYESDDLVGRAGIERRYEQVLRARRGLVTDHLDVRGQLRSSTTVREPTNGRDLVLTIDSALQRSAQSLLDQAIARRLSSGNEAVDRSAGGAILVLDIHNGGVLAAASAPRFNPNSFSLHESVAIESWLHNPARPLFDRAVQMSLPPGSVFKIVSAAAIMDSGVDSRSPVNCQGYLRRPDALRCALFRHYGIGHGAVTLADALARSCNVYFFHHAEQLGHTSLLNWAARLGCGEASGIDLPGEAVGALRPRANAQQADKLDARQIAIGQGPLTVTPLQMARVVAAIGNGGFLVTPHVVDRAMDQAGQFSISDQPAFASPRPIPGLTEEILSPIRKGLIQAVADEQGTAHATVGLAQVPVAGKTGTAETGGRRPEHAWFVGYAPVDQPRVAFVVVIEYAGNAGNAAGPAAQHLVDKMTELGYFSKRVAKR